MKRTGIKTPEQVKREFAQRGESIADWCKRHHVSPAAAYRVLREQPVRAKRGECHKAAVLLGLKVGVVVEGQQ